MTAECKRLWKRLSYKIFGQSCDGQALGLLVLLRFIGYPTST